MLIQLALYLANIQNLLIMTVFILHIFVHSDIFLKFYLYLSTLLIVYINVQNKYSIIVSLM